MMILFIFLGWGWGGGSPYFSSSYFFSLVNVRLHTENWLHNLPASALKVPVVVVMVESEHSDQLWLSLDQAEEQQQCTSLQERFFLYFRL